MRMSAWMLMLKPDQIKSLRHALGLAACNASRPAKIALSAVLRSGCTCVETEKVLTTEAKALGDPWLQPYLVVSGRCRIIRRMDGAASANAVATAAACL
jgi:hypothetical protein